MCIKPPIKLGVKSKVGAVFLKAFLKDYKIRGVTTFDSFVILQIYVLRFQVVAMLGVWLVWGRK